MRKGDQPKPKPTTGRPIWDLVVEDMKARDHLGRKRYGTPLQANNGRDALQDAYEEALDLAVYLRQALEERDQLEELEEVDVDWRKVDKVPDGWLDRIETANVLGCHPNSVYRAVRDRGLDYVVYRGRHFYNVGPMSDGQLVFNEWRTLGDISSALDTTRSSIYRKVEKGELETKFTSKGILYRLAH